MHHKWCIDTLKFHNADAHSYLKIYKKIFYSYTYTKILKPQYDKILKNFYNNLTHTEMY